MRKKVSNRAVSLVLTLAMLFSMVVVAMPQDVSAADPEFKSAKSSYVDITDEQSYQCYSTGQPVWIKFKAKNNGYLEVKAKKNTQLPVAYVTGSWKLFDKSKRKVLSSTMDFNTNYSQKFYTTESYGVKKGTTYYLAVYADAGGVRIQASFKKVNDKSGTKKSKALNLKKGRMVTGLIQAGSKASHFYKFKLTSRKKMSVLFTPYLTDSVSLMLTGTNMRAYSDIIPKIEYDYREGKYYNNWGAKDKVTGTVGPGTYYIQIKPTKLTTNGRYTLVWK